MPAIRFRPNDVCACVLSNIPGGMAYLKKSPKARQPLASVPVAWLGFICKAGARMLPSARAGRLIASSITNGDGVCSEWRELASDQYVVCMLLQIGDAHQFGAFGVVDLDGWPIVRNDDAPKLTVVTPRKARIRAAG